MKNIPISNKINHVISDNQSKINIDQILSWGDDYELIFTANKKFRNKIINLGKQNKVKLSKIGSVIKTKGIFDDSMTMIKKLSSFDHFS